jgi:iron complex outermembrane recepter protein
MVIRKSTIALSITQALLGGAFATSALAQTAPPASTADEASLGVITVTAQSRSQQSQAVPIQMQIVTADQIDKLAANNLADLNGYIPGLSVDDSQPTQPNYSIRGIGSGDFGIGTEAPVGVYVDGVYTGKTGGALMNFNDVQRVEILKGPQGTLFGRNSAAGAVSVVSKEPSDNLELEGHVRFGQYGERYDDTLVNLPLSDTSALRIAFVDTKTGGWLTDAGTGQKLNGTSDWAMRSTLRWDAPGQTKVLLSWEHESLDQAAKVDIGLIPMSLQTPTPPYPVNPSTFLNPLNAPVYNDVAGDMETRVFDAVTLRVEHPLGWATLNSTTAYRHFNSGNLEGNDGTNQLASYLDTNNVENDGTWQQELKLSGKNDTLDWLAGASAYFETGRQINQFDTYTDALNTTLNNEAGFPLYSQLNGAAQQFGIPVNLLGNTWQESMFNKNIAKSYALYGDAIWHVTQQLNLTAGVRFSYDEKEFSWFNPPRVAPGLDSALNVLNQVGFFPGLVQAGALSAQQAAMAQGLMTQNLVFNNAASTNAAVSASDSWTNVSPRLVLDYKLAPDVMAYASVTKGYQAGGFSALNVGTEEAPETVVNYEAGIKSYFRPQHLTVNASIFSYKFSNLPSLALVPVPGSTVSSYQVVTSDETATGADLDARWQPTHDLKLFFVSEFIDQKYGQHIAQDTFGNYYDVSNQPTGTPLWSAAGGFDYTQRGVWGGSIDYSLQHAYTGAQRCNAASYALGGNCESVPAFTVGGAEQHTDGRIGWDSGDHKWGVALYGRNLFNNRYVGGFDTTGTASLGTVAAGITPPRMMGVELHASM